MKRGAVRKTLAAVLGVTFAALVTILSFVLDRARPSHAAVSFTPRDVEQAQREVLPYRQSGLVFHWADDSPNVYVTRSMWEALSDDSRRKLGRSMAIAKNRREIAVFDESLVAKIAVCTAAYGCTPVGRARGAASR
jgi:hypothetical protein